MLRVDLWASSRASACAANAVDAAADMPLGAAGVALAEGLGAAPDDTVGAGVADAVSVAAGESAGADAAADAAASRADPVPAQALSRPTRTRTPAPLVTAVSPLPVRRPGRRLTGDLGGLVSAALDDPTDRRYGDGPSRLCGP